METETSGMSAYEQQREAEKSRAQRRHQMAVQVADQLVLRLNVFPEAQWVRGIRDSEYGIAESRVRVLNLQTKAEVEIFPGGYRRQGRIIASVVDYRHVEFGPNDFDTVRASLPLTDATFDETKDPAIIAKQIDQRGIVASAIEAAVLLDAAVARASAERDKGHARVTEFQRAGWQVNTNDGRTGYAYVPDGHALRLFGIGSLRIDLKTGGITYGYTPYLPHDTTPEDLIGLTV